jgi:4-hydroxy-4-methyl-2-oxoglutarate aldolase
MSVYSKKFLTQACKLGTATLFEASNIATTAVDYRIRPIWAGVSVAGPAYPVECAPGDNLGIQIALERAPHGAVLVVDAKGFVAGYWGEVLTVYAQAVGIAGLVIDGGVRDTAALVERRFPVFSRGISVKGTIKASVPSVGNPISMTGVPVALGDLVVADDDGVVIIPAEHAQATVNNGQQRFEKEEVMMAKLATGGNTLDLMGLSHWRDQA